MRSGISLEALQVLDAIERSGSFAAAATELHRVPSAVSYTVARLEDDLGVAVFDRSGHRARLTPAGRLLLEEGRRILAASNELATAARRLAEGWEPRLGIAVDGLVDTAALWPLVATFCAEHPYVDVRVFEEVLGGTAEALLDGRADLVVGLADRPAAVGISARPLGDVEFVFAAAPHHPITAEPTPLTAAAIRRHRAVAVADSARRSPPLTIGLLDTQPRLTVTSMTAKIDAQRRGLGVGFLPRHRVRQLLAGGELVALELALPRAPSRIHIAWRSEASGKALAWFLARLKTPAQLAALLDPPGA